MILYVGPICRHAPRLFMEFGIIGKVSIGQLRDGYCRFARFPFPTDIDACCDLPKPRACNPPCLVRSDAAVRSNRRAPLLAESGPIIDEVNSAPGWSDL